MCIRDSLRRVAGCRTKKHSCLLSTFSASVDRLHKDQLNVCSRCTQHRPTSSLGCRERGLVRAVSLVQTSTPDRNVMGKRQSVEKIPTAYPSRRHTSTHRKSETEGASSHTHTIRYVQRKYNVQLREESSLRWSERDIEVIYVQGCKRASC